MATNVNEPLAFLDSLDSVYDVSILPAMKARYAAIHKKFVELNHVEPTYYLRAPGRVNIIGEHIDYHGYGVLPIAIANDIVMAVYADDTASDEIVVQNLDDAYPSGSFSSDPKNTIEGHSWIKYFQCGYKGVFDNKPFASTKMIVLVDGNIARAGGLSSSSAYVVASALATAQAHHISFTRKELAELCRVAEYACLSPPPRFYIGTMGGGMDQSISCFGMTNCALHITFQPLDASVVSFPPGGAIVVANSYVSAEKAVSANQHFNKRVVEGIFAAKVIGKLMGVTDFIKLNRLKDLQEAFTPIKSFEEMLAITEKYLHSEPYTKAELEELLGCKLTQEVLFPTRSAAKGVLEENNSYLLKLRALHVFSEAKRVIDFIAVCKKPHYPSQLEDLGKLMNESHTSCHEQYDCSCPELETLVSQERHLGSLGSRLTGAGWGGCTVSLIKESTSDSFLQSLKEGYMKDRKIADADLSFGLFATKPCVGAALLSPKIL